MALAHFHQGYFGTGKRSILCVFQKCLSPELSIPGAYALREFINIRTLLTTFRMIDCFPFNLKRTIFLV
jgi:hypothetical protein